MNVSPSFTPRVSEPEASVKAILADARALGAAALEEDQAKALLRALGIATPNGVRVGVGGDLTAALEAINPPFALKALAATALHKSDVGAVRLGLVREEVEGARATMGERLQAAGVAVTGFLVEEMAATGVELVIGGSIDPQLGPMLMIGSGGVFAEILDDVAFGICPIERDDARDMLDELKALPVLMGARGRTPVNLDAIVDALVALGGPGGFFTLNSGSVREFDLNPVFARPDGITAVDARFVLNQEGAR